MRFSALFAGAVGVILGSLARADPLRYNVSLNSQVRSAYNGPTGMTISWNTYYELEKPTVHYGLSPDKLLNRAAGGESVTYASSLTYNNHVKLEGLKPDTQYWYLPEHLINSSSLVGPFTFKTAKPSGDPTPFSMAVVVDMGATGSEGLSDTAGKGIIPQDILLPGEQNTIQSFTTSHGTYDFVLHPGDLAYADTWMTEVNQGYLNATKDLEGGAKAYESILDDFYDQLTNVTAKVPYMVGPGNHEANCVDTTYDCPAGQNNFTGYINHFRMPSDVASQAVGNLGVGNMWYSFDYGMVHYVVVSMETDFPNNPDASFGNGPFGYSGEQTDWLAADLKSIDRCLTPWVIVVGHRPWYSSSSSPCTACQTAFESLFVEYEIDLYMSGHYHVYERMVPIGLNGTADPQGLDNPTSPWYILNGIGGHYGGLNPFNVANPYQKYGLDQYNATYGWSRLSFHNRTHMTHELVNSSSNAVLDSATLYKSHSKCFPALSLNVSSIPSAVISSTKFPSSSLLGSSVLATSKSPSSDSSYASSTVAFSNTTRSASVSITSDSKTISVSETTSPVLFTTSTVYITSLSTVYNCAPTVTSCLYRSIVTKTIPAYTTVFPVIIVESQFPAKEDESATKTVFTTSTYTVSSCATTVTNCPYGATTTETIPLYTTVCPITEIKTGLSSAVPESNASTTTGAEDASTMTASKISAPGIVATTEIPAKVPAMISQVSYTTSIVANIFPVASRYSASVPVGAGIGANSTIATFHPAVITGVQVVNTSDAPSGTLATARLSIALFTVAALILV